MNAQNKTMTESEVSETIDDLEKRIVNIGTRLNQYIQLNGAGKKLKRKAKAYFQEIEQQKQESAKA